MAVVIESLQMSGGLERRVADSEVTPRGRKPAQGEPVIDRAFALLSAFNPNRRSLSLTDLARLSGQPTSTTLRLANRLVAWGALERRADGRYVVGLRMWQVGALAPRSMGLRQVALPHMTDLVEATHENVLLVVLDGDKGLIVERLSGHLATFMPYSATGEIPLYFTASGLVLLAHASPTLQEAVLAGPMPMPPSRTPADPREVRRQLAEGRRDGAVIIRAVPTSATPAVASAAVAIRSKGQVVAALSVVMHGHGNEPTSLLPALRVAASAIARGLDQVPAPIVSL
jgi:DNA-binding IclR family transcriptional regulator